MQPGNTSAPSTYVAVIAHPRSQPLARSMVAAAAPPVDSVEVAAAAPAPMEKQHGVVDISH